MNKWPTHIILLLYFNHLSGESQILNFSHKSQVLYWSVIIAVAKTSTLLNMIGQIPNQDDEEMRWMNWTATVTAFWEAKEANREASLERAGPPPARSESALNAMKGVVVCWRHTSATAAVSISIGLTLNLDLRKPLYAALSTNVLALHPLSTFTTFAFLGKHVVAFTQFSSSKSFMNGNKLNRTWMCFPKPKCFNLYFIEMFRLSIFF